MITDTWCLVPGTRGTDSFDNRFFAGSIAYFFAWMLATGSIPVHSQPLNLPLFQLNYVHQGPLKLVPVLKFVDMRVEMVVYKHVCRLVVYHEPVNPFDIGAFEF